MSQTFISPKEGNPILHIHGERVVNKVYHNYRLPFIRWAINKYNCSYADAEDVFQDAVFAIYRNVDNQRLRKKKMEISNPKAYLFKTGANMFIKRIAKQRREEACLTVLQNTTEGGCENGEERLLLIRGMMQKMNASLRQTLELYYLKGYCHEAVAREMNYKTPFVAKTIKQRGLKDLVERCGAS